MKVSRRYAPASGSPSLRLYKKPPCDTGFRIKGNSQTTHSVESSDSKLLFQGLPKKVVAEAALTKHSYSNQVQEQAKTDAWLCTLGKTLRDSLSLSVVHLDIEYNRKMLTLKGSDNLPTSPLSVALKTVLQPVCF
jgi:hypothetical protein